MRQGPAARLTSLCELNEMMPRGENKVVTLRDKRNLECHLSMEQLPSCVIAQMYNEGP